jgi:putative transcriptional regulator
MPKTLPPLVKSAREDAGLTQVSLAKAVATSRQHLQRIESGRMTPTVYLAMRIANAVGRSVQELFPIGGKSPKKAKPQTKEN